VQIAAWTANVSKPNVANGFLFAFFLTSQVLWQLLGTWLFPVNDSRHVEDQEAICQFSGTPHTS
jgi:hypothetical protein